MRELIERILAAYGSGMTIVCADGEKAVRAFLQPVTEKSRETMRKTIGMLGEIPVGRFLYVGPAEPALPENAEVRFGASATAHAGRRRWSWRTRRCMCGGF